MSGQSDRVLPELAGRPFLEKPPLSYWIAGGAIALLGDSGAAARVPNLLYASIAAVSIGVLALALQGSVISAVFAALVALSALIAFRAAIWLAPDAALLAGCALALAGLWRGYTAPAGGRKASGYALMHLGAALGFMAKSAPGWLVPALALLTLIVWERRWAELGRWELYAGLALQALVIGPWLYAVAHSADGTQALRALFWHNTVGRFTRIESPADLDYTTGHRNFPGKYLLELPLYLLPWTLITVAALARAAQRARAAGARGTPWRFAVAASVPFLALLSIAATARDVYAAPALLGFGLLAGLWAQEAGHAPLALDRWAVRATRELVTALAWVLALTLLVLAVCGEGSQLTCLAAAAGTVATAHVARFAGARAQRTGHLHLSVGWIYTGYAAAVCVSAFAALPVVDRWQDLPELARRIRADTAHEQLALLDPDETTIAILDRGLATPFAILRSDGRAAQQVAGEWLKGHGREARVLVLLPGHAPGRLTRWLEPFLGPSREDDGIAGGVAASGAAVFVARYQLPQGRRYALLGPPS
ncbi:MAG: glycosyltransferase family 39 protein [Gammaproteobacteria bacterium]|nr:glycosyltransferase family 39 protein [Gammaproteobacteria bacterium]